LRLGSLCLGDSKEKILLNHRGFANDYRFLVESICIDQSRAYQLPMRCELGVDLTKEKKVDD
jgi:hypothetical protein